VSREVMICSFCASSIRREVMLTVSPRTSPLRTTTGPDWKAMRTPSLVLPTGGSASAAICIAEAASAAAVGAGNNAITSSPVARTNVAPPSQAARSSTATQFWIACNALVGPALA
jgi:hypothetical protein